MAVFDEPTQAALHLADAMSGASYELDPVLVSELRSVFSETELAELVRVWGEASLNNRGGNAGKQLLGP